MIGLAGRDDEPTAPEHALPVLPATVAAAHFTASAAELAQLNGPRVGDLADLAAVVDQLVVGQRHISDALARLSRHLSDRYRDGALSMVEARDVAALTDVLAAAATATGHAAGALSQGRPVLDIVLASAGPDARI